MTLSIYIYFYLFICLFTHIDTGMKAVSSLLVLVCDAVVELDELGRTQGYSN